MHDRIPELPVDLSILARQERLERWTDLLERDGELPVRLCAPSWCLSGAERALPAETGSAMEIALADPIFRLAGLRGTSFDDAVEFFELNDRDADRILSQGRGVCSRRAGEVSRRIRNVADKRREHFLLANAVACSIGLAAALSVVAYFFSGTS